MRFMSLATALLLAIILATAQAADTSTPDGPDLSAPRAAIKAGDYRTAITALKNMLEKGRAHADIHNLLGYSYRKSGDFNNASYHYEKALTLDPDHKSALEYQGEMFIEMGNADAARGNRNRLVQLCPNMCEEREDLEAAMDKARIER